MISPIVVAVFFLGAIAAITVVHALDVKAIRREEKFWSDLRDQALHGYGRVFDWAEDPDA